jgi:hypothetical protein
MFGVPDKNNDGAYIDKKHGDIEYGSDHWGIRACFNIGQSPPYPVPVSLVSNWTILTTLGIKSKRSS